MKWKIDFIQSDSTSYKNTSEYTCIVIADDCVTAVEIAKERVSKLDRQIKYDYCYYTCICIDSGDNDNHFIINDDDVDDDDSSNSSRTDNNSGTVDTRERIEQEIDEYLERSYTKDAIDTGYNLQDLLLSNNNTKRRMKTKLVILYTVLIVVTAMLSAGLTTVMLHNK